VACNGKLREVARATAAELNLPIYFPSPHLSTDNAAMIAAAGTVKLIAGERGSLDMNADVTLRLQNLDLEEEAAKRAGVRYRL
jgi:N6-L-threonylcarbamoyladenine synthase